MGFRYPVPEFVRACALLALTVLLSIIAPSLVGRAQSAPPALTPWRGLIDHASVTVNGQATQASVDLSARSLSADGRFVLMTSYAWDLVSDQDYYQGVFLRDRAKGTTRRVSVGNDGTTPQDGGSFAGSMNANGRQIAFMSSATNLVQGDTNGVWDIFVRDLDAERTVRVSVAADGTQTDADSYWPAISATGRFVAFSSQASNLAPGGLPYEPAQVYLHDRDANGNGIFDEPGGVETSLVSVSPNGGRADSWTRNIRISGDGRVVLFESQATNLVAGTMLDGTTNHVYVHDRQLHQTTLVDRAVTGGPSSWGVSADSSDLSDDARYVTFSSVSPDIVWLDMNWTAQVFRHDRADNTANQTVIVSQLSDGTLANGNTYSTAVSGDGRYVVLRTVASNLASPSSEDGRGSVIVRDMADDTFARVDVVGDGSAFNHWYPYNVSISADGTAVAFNSDATNVVYSPNPSAQHVFVATAFAASPASASYPMEGGAGSIEVNTLPYTGWNAVSLDPWITLTDGGGFEIGPRVVNYIVDSNPLAIVRDGRIQLGSMIVTIHQEGDGDQTPPVITPMITGTQVNGWYTSDITQHWEISDPESPFDVTQGCNDAVYTTDFMLTTPSCSATSHGGTSYLSVSLRRDTTAPTIAITAPAATTYPLGFTFTPGFSCSDGGGSGVASCIATTPMDTSTPGRKVFTVTATDMLGHSSTRSVEYTVGTGVCVAPNEAVQAWFRFEYNSGDVYGLFAAPVPSGSVLYNPAIAGAGLRGQGNNHLAATDAAGRLRIGQQMTIAAWVASSGAATSSATIVASAGQYRLAVFPDSSLRWAFNLPSGFNWVNTGVTLPRRADVFTHLAVTYNGGLVQTYVNGRLAHSQQLDGVVSSSGNIESITIGGRADLYTPFYGVLDELQLYGAALTESEIEAIALAGNGSLCLPQTTTLTVSSPESVSYMGQAAVSAQLLDEAGQPVMGKPVSIDTFLSSNGANTGGALATTDANGKVNALIYLGSNSAPGTYPNGVRASFHGDARYRGSYTSAATSVVRGTPAMTWTPGAITYGTPLGPQQLNATANTTGTFSYLPAAGTLLDAGVHPLSVTFTPHDPANWEPVTFATTIQVSRMTPTVGITVGTYTYDKQPHPAAVAVTGANGETLSPTQVSYNDSQTVPASAGSYWVSAYYGGSANYNAASASSSTPLIIKKYVPTVEMHGGPYTYDGTQHYPSIYVRGAGGDYLDPFGYFFDGWTYTIPVNAGTHTVQVQYNGDYNYEAIKVEDLSFVINQATPSIWMFTSNRFYNGSPQVTDAWASGINSESLTPVVVTYNGSTTAPADVGSYALVATYNGSLNYNAVSTTGSMTILQGTPWLTWADPAPIVYGTPLGATQLNATAPTSGRFYYAQAAGTVLPAGMRTLSVLFVPDDQSNWLSANNSVALTVAKATPSVTWNITADMTYDTVLGTAQLNASANVPGTFAYSPSAGARLPAGTHTLSVAFTPDDAANYTAGSASVTLNVLKATPLITWVPPADLSYGAPLSALQLNVSASVAGTYEFSPAPGTILPAGRDTLSVLFTPEDAANYSTATASVVVNVLRATPIVDWVTPAEITYGAPLGSGQLTAAASTAGTFTYSPGAGTVLSAGTHTLGAAFAPDDAANYNTASASVVLSVARATPNVTWAAPQAIVYGTPLGAVQLNATADVAGAFTYLPAAGTILSAGSHTLALTFTPHDAANYSGATGTVTLNVTRAPTTVNWNAPAAIVYGTPLTAAQLDASASAPGTFTYSPAAGTVLPAGPGVLSVTFTPEDPTNYTGTSASTTMTVMRAPLTVTATDSIKPFGQPLPAFTSTFAGLVNGDSPASFIGMVTYATTASAASPVGTYAVAPSGVSSPNYSVTFASGTLSVVRAATVVTAAASPNPIGFNQPVTFSANVAHAGAGLGSPTGSVQFFDGATLIGTVAVTGGAVALTTAGLPAGTHTLTATYSGDSSFTGHSTSATFTVNSAAASSTVTVSTSPNPSNVGQAVTFNAGVSAPAGSLSGRVDFYDGSTLLGTAPIVGTTASFTTSALTVRGHAITARFSGSASVPPSLSAAVAHTVQASGAKAKATTTTVAASPAPAALGSEVALTAAVSGSQNRVPSGTVVFFANGTVIGTAALSATGSVTAKATLRISSLPHGAHSISAVYLADAAYRASGGAVVAPVN